MGTQTAKFKEYDRIFAGQTHDLVLNTPRSALAAADREIDRWVYPVTYWKPEFVAYCVYEASDHEDWQKFRVSLKGMTTAQKLYMLRIYRGHKYLTRDALTYTAVATIDCRIDNYIGALRRGGQLDQYYIIAKER